MDTISSTDWPTLPGPAQPSAPTIIRAPDIASLLNSEGPYVDGLKQDH